MAFFFSMTATSSLTANDFFFTRPSLFALSLHVLLLVLNPMNMNNMIVLLPLSIDINARGPSSFLTSSLFFAQFFFSSSLRVIPLRQYQELQRRHQPQQCPLQRPPLHLFLIPVIQLGHFPLRPSEGPTRLHLRQPPLPRTPLRLACNRCP